MSDEREEKLLELLQQQGLLEAQQIKAVGVQAQEQGVSVEEVLTREALVAPEALAQAKSTLFGLPYVDLGQVGVSDEAMEGISRKAVVQYKFVPFAVKDDSLLVATSSPDDFQAQEAIKFIARRRGLTAQLHIATPQAIERALEGASVVKAEIGGALSEFSRELEAAGGVGGKDGADIERIMEEAPVTKVVAVIIRHAIEGAASDIHIEPEEKELRIRYRIDGQLHTTLTLPLKVHAAIISRVKILANLKIDEQRLPQDGRFSVTIEGRAYDFRVSTMPTTFGEKVALRILDKSAGAPTFEDLGLRGPMKDILETHLQAPHGIILISGPTGAGKSTTLFAAMATLNTPNVNIVTLEDPVEYEIEGVNQTQIHPAIGLTFASGLRNMLRQDPDIIMVGEIRDKETAELAVHASLTGHLVLSTIHTNDAIGTVPRLADMGVDPFLLAASLRLLAAQRLVGKLCPHCKHEVPLQGNVKEKVMQAMEGIPEQYFTEENQRSPSVLFESEGCPQCHESGTIGRTGIFEMVPVSRSLRGAMNDTTTYDTLKDIALEEGAITMRQDGLLKALAGEVAYEDVLRVTAEAEEES